jgi:RNA polymerase sigma-70 factor (ECF subfamily)
VPLEFVGLESAARFLRMVPFRPGHPKRVTLTRANGQPAFVVYGPDTGGVWRSVGLLVFTLSGDRISAITRFEQSVLPAFGAPDELA